MPYCTNCGKPISEGSNFCSFCGASRENYYEEEKTSTRKMEYAGTVLKCPSCGNEIDDFTSICPACGHVISKVDSSSAVKDFAAKINQLDSQLPTKRKGWSSWPVAGRVWFIISCVCIFPWVFLFLLVLMIGMFRAGKVYAATLCSLFFPPIAVILFYIIDGTHLSKKEKERAIFIENYVFPNDKRTIIEAIMYIKHKAEEVLDYTKDGYALFCIKMWSRKSQSLLQKSRMLIEDNREVKEAYVSIQAIKRKITKAALIRKLVPVFILLIEAVIFCGICFIPPVKHFNHIDKQDASFGNWLSDNYYIGDGGVDIEIIDNGTKARFDVDVICKENPADEILSLLGSEESDGADWSLKGGHVDVGTFGMVVGRKSVNQQNAWDFVMELFEMNPGEEKILSITVKPDYYQKYLFRDYMDMEEALWQIELTYTNGQETKTINGLSER